ASSAADEAADLPPPSTGREPSELVEPPPTPPDTSETGWSPAETLAVPSPRPLTSSSVSDDTTGRTPRSVTPRTVSPPKVSATPSGRCPTRPSTSRSPDCNDVPSSRRNRGCPSSVPSNSALSSSIASKNDNCPSTSLCPVPSAIFLTLHNATLASPLSRTGQCHTLVYPALPRLGA